MSPRTTPTGSLFAPFRRWWRKRQYVNRRCWYCEGIFRFPRWPGLHGEEQFNEWYCPECRR